MLQSCDVRILTSENGEYLEIFHIWFKMQYRLKTEELKKRGLNVNGKFPTS